MKITRFVGDFAFSLLRIIASILFVPLGTPKVRGRDRCPLSGPLLILANHISDVDPVVVQMACPRIIRFMAKEPLFKIRILGWLIKKMGAFSVKPGSPDRNAIRAAVTILDSGAAVCVFPEGQLSEDGGLLPLKEGIALIARMSGARIICLGLRGTDRILPYGELFPRPSFHRPLCQWGEARLFPRDSSVAEIMGWAEGQLRELTGQKTS